MSTNFPFGARAAVLATAAAIPLAASGTLLHQRTAPAPPTIAISGVYTRALRDSGAAKRARVFDSLLADGVRQQGFAVISHDSVDALARRTTDSLGGAIDPTTGARDTVRVTRIDGAIRGALAARYRAAFWMRPHIITEAVEFRGAEATWRGTTEKTGAPGGLTGAIFGTKKGRLPALTLVVFVEDMSGRTLLARSGGIQLTTKAGGVGSQPTEVRPSALLADPARNEHAVRVALDSLAARLAAQRGLVALQGGTR